MAVKGELNKKDGKATEVSGWIRLIPLESRDLIAAASMVVALSSMYVAWTAFSNDATYKEISIRPAISFHFTDDFALNVANYGLGPALVTRSVIGHNGECHYSPTDEAGFESWRTSKTVLSDRVGREIYKDILPTLAKLDTSYRDSYPFVSFQPDKAVLPANASTTTFSMRSFQTMAPVAYTREADFMEVLQKVRADWPPKSMRFYYRLTYSSMTENFKSVAEVSLGGMKCP